MNHPLGSHLMKFPLNIHLIPSASAATPVALHFIHGSFRIPVSNKWVDVSLQYPDGKWAGGPVGGVYLLTVVVR